MPFEKGKSGNPGGRKKGENPLVDLARAHCEEAMLGIIDLSKNAKDDKIKLRAKEIIIERAWGKAVQAMELSGADGDPLSVGIVFNLKTHKSADSDENKS